MGGFAFICYEDQRSTILAVDNMNGAQILSRTLRVNHVDKYKAPKILDENDLDENGDPKLLEYKPTGAEGAGHEVYNVVGSQKKMDEINSKRKSKPVKFEKQDEDEAWAQSFEAEMQKLGAEDARIAKKKKEKKKNKKFLKKALKEIKKMEKETELLKLEAKKAKEEAKRRKRERTNT